MALSRIITLAVLCVAALATGVNDTPSRTDVPAQEQVARLQQVRLRKLHLVRPDLIPYPLSFEIVC